MDSFINGFCKVEFLCYQGEPNWLGWLILIPFFLIIAFIVGLFFVGQYALFTEWVDEAREQAEKEDSTFVDRIRFLFASLVQIIFFFICFGVIMILAYWVFFESGFFGDNPFD